MESLETTTIALLYQRWPFNKSKDEKQPDNSESPPLTVYAYTLRIIHYHAAMFLTMAIFPSLCHLAALCGTVSGCPGATFIIPHVHFPCVPWLLYLCFLFFFDVFPSNPGNPQNVFFFWGL